MSTAAAQATVNALSRSLLGRGLVYELRKPLNCPHRGLVSWDRLPYEQAQRDVCEANIERTKRRNLTEPSPISEPEIVLLAALRFYGENPLLQHQVGPYDLDFYIPDYQAAIEVDGFTFHDISKDIRRDQIVLDLAGIRTYRTPASDVMRDPLWVVRKLARNIVEGRRSRACHTS